MNIKNTLVATAIFIVSAIRVTASGVTFEIEELSKPKELLTEYNLKNDYEKNFLYTVYAHSEIPDSMVCVNTSNTMYNIVYHSYMDHRPLVLSPDMIWLMIAQGFAKHVENNAEELRHFFVDFDGKETLKATIDFPNDMRTEEILRQANWNSIIQTFPELIAEYTGDKLIKELSADFSTTTIVEKVACDITIMKAMESYFEYELDLISCGIPRITLLGTPNDWQQVYDKAMALKNINLNGG